VLGLVNPGSARFAAERGRQLGFSHLPLGEGLALLRGNAGVADLAHAIERLDEAPRLRPARLGLTHLGLAHFGKSRLFRRPCALTFRCFRRSLPPRLVGIGSLALGRFVLGRRRSCGVVLRGLLALTFEQGLGIGTRGFGFDDEAARLLDQLRPFLRRPHVLGLAASACQHVGFIGAALLGGPARALRGSILSAALFACRPVLSLLSARWNAIGVAGEPLRDGAGGIARVRGHRTHRHGKPNNRTRAACDRPSRHDSLPDL
jgi:hypothetical protein